MSPRNAGLFYLFIRTRASLFFIPSISLSELVFGELCHYYYYIRRAICAGVFDISL